MFEIYMFPLQTMYFTGAHTSEETGISRPTLTRISNVPGLQHKHGYH